jgi:hypothetical protein
MAQGNRRALSHGPHHYFLGEDAQARVAFEKYLHNRRHGVGSIYDVKEVKKQLAELPAAG